MMPVFMFIGCGILISLDIMQPSMFNNLYKNLPLFIAGGLIGCAPLLLVNAIIKSLTNLYNNGFKIGLILAFIVSGIFMTSETLYSYISLKTVYADQSVPTIKILGILMLPFTFSIFYLSRYIIDNINYHPQKNEIDLLDLKNEIKRLEGELNTESLALKIAPDYYTSKTEYDIQRDAIVNKIIEKGLSIIAQK